MRGCFVPAPSLSHERERLHHHVTADASDASGGRCFAVCCKGGSGGARPVICCLLSPYHNDEATRGSFAAAPSLVHERNFSCTRDHDTGDASYALGGRHFAACCKGLLVRGVFIAAPSPSHKRECSRSHHLDTANSSNVSGGRRVNCEGTGAGAAILPLLSHHCIDEVIRGGVVPAPLLLHEIERTCGHRDTGDMSLPRGRQVVPLLCMGAGGASSLSSPHTHGSSLSLPHSKDDKATRGFAAPSLSHERHVTVPSLPPLVTARSASQFDTVASCLSQEKGTPSNCPMPTPPLVTFSSSPTGMDAWDTLQRSSNDAMPGLMMTPLAAGDAQPTSAPLSLSSCWHQGICPDATFVCATESLPHTNGIASP
jgi:hypothetical protein